MNDKDRATLGEISSKWIQATILIFISIFIAHYFFKNYYSLFDSLLYWTIPLSATSYAIHFETVQMQRFNRDHKISGSKIVLAALVLIFAFQNEKRNLEKYEALEIAQNICENVDETTINQDECENLIQILSPAEVSFGDQEY